MLEAVGRERAKRAAAAYLAYLAWLADSPPVVDAPVGVVGYCTGVRLALYTAGTHPNRVAALAGFHGGSLATDSPRLLAERMTAELYLAHADRDPWMSEEQIRLLAKALAEADVEHRCRRLRGRASGVRSIRPARPTTGSRCDASTGWDRTPGPKSSPDGRIFYLTLSYQHFPVRDIPVRLPGTSGRLVHRRPVRT
jgi:dienelactone hydrolase